MEPLLAAAGGTPAWGVLPFALLLAFGSLALMGGGAAMLAEGADQGRDAGDEGGSLIDADVFGSGDGDDGARDDGRVVAGASLIGFGILGAIVAVVLVAAALTARDEDGRQQQQQQVIVVTDPNARVETWPPR